MTLELLDRHTISDVRVHDDDAQKALRYIKMLMRDGVDKHIENVRGEMWALVVDKIWVLPVFVPRAGYRDMAYVGSLYSHYISYAMDELHELHSPLGRFFARWIIRGLGVILRLASINKAVFINNWLLSTNLYPDMPAEYIDDISIFIAKQFPGRFVVWNSINAKTTPKLHDEFIKRHYTTLFSRSIWIQDTYANLGSKIDGVVRREYALRESSPYLTSGQFDAARISKLYSSLYVDKYSRYNPIFTPHFMTETHREEIFSYQTLAKPDMSIDGVIGYIIIRNVLTTPILGYNSSVPRADGLYRILPIQLQDIAKTNEYVFHSSAGVGDFKRSRGARNYREYRMIFPGNVGTFRRYVMNGLAQLTEFLATHLIEKKGL